MAFRLTKVTCFAQGAWNIYILQPEWLSRKGVFAPDRPVTVEALATGPGVRLSAGRKAPRWVATPFQVQIEAEKPGPADDVGEPLARLVEALPDTPLHGAGFEFVYQSPAGKDIQAVPVPPQPPRPGEPLVRHGASLCVRRGGADYFLELSHGGPDEPARLSGLCTCPAGSDGPGVVGHLRAYQDHDTILRDIAGYYWQVAFS